MNTTTNKTTGLNHHACACKCGFGTHTAKATYIPGHDARHVSNLLAELIAGGDLSNAAVNTIARRLPSIPLQVKLQRAVDNFVLRQEKKRQPRTEWIDLDTCDYKIGRWTYPVQGKIKPGNKSEILDYRRNIQRDGSGEWIKLEGGEMVGR